MSNKLITLNERLHRNLKVKPNETFKHAKDQNLIPIVVEELVSAASEFPVVFAKNANNDNFTLVAMMAIRKGHNYYCNGPFTGNYVPLALQLYPFALRYKDKNNSPQMEVCVREDSVVLSEQSGHALFTDSGEQTPFLQQQTQFLMRHHQQLRITHSFIDLLQENKLLREHTFDIVNNNSQKLSIAGVYIVDQHALDNLEDQMILKLRKSGALQAIYAHLASLKQFSRLARLSKEFETE